MLRPVNIFWPVPPFLDVCPNPRDCLTSFMARQGFTVEGAVSGEWDRTYAKIRLADGRTGFVRVSAPDIEWSTTDPDAKFRRDLANLEKSRRERAAIEAKYCTGGDLRIGMDTVEAI